MSVRRTCPNNLFFFAEQKQPKLHLIINATGEVTTAPFLFPFSTSITLRMSGEERSHLKKKETETGVNWILQHLLRYTDINLRKAPHTLFLRVKCNSSSLTRGLLLHCVDQHGAHSQTFIPVCFCDIKKNRAFERTQLYSLHFSWLTSTTIFQRQSRSPAVWGECQPEASECSIWVRACCFDLII